MHSDFLGLTRFRLRALGYCPLIAFADDGKMSLQPIVLASDVATNIRASHRVEFVGYRIRGVALGPGAVEDNFQFGRETPGLIGRDIDRTRQMQLAKLVFGKHIDKDDFLRMIELPLTFVPINVADHKYNLQLDA